MLNNGAWDGKQLLDADYVAGAGKVGLACGAVWCATRCGTPSVAAGVVLCVPCGVCRADMACGGSGCAVVCAVWCVPR